MINKAYEYLNRDRLLNLDMLETLKRDMGEVVYADNDGVVLLNTGYTYMISVDSEEALKKICRMIKRPKLIAMHQAKFIPRLQELYGYKHQMECFQCAYLSSEKLDEKVSDGVELRELTLNELDFVVKNYDHSPDEDYISERIKAGMIGAYCGDDIAGFIGTHAEGTIGILQVLPDFRRRGIAYSLEAAMINRMLSKNWIPIGHVVTTNKASLQLQEKLGMSFSDKTVTWMFDE